MTIKVTDLQRTELSSLYCAMVEAGEFTFSASEKETIRRFLKHAEKLAAALDAAFGGRMSDTL